MCGIIGFVGRENAVEKVLCGLSRLEYRGYDSCGISYFDAFGKVITQKTQGRVDNLKKVLSPFPHSQYAIGHTRWATHGSPSQVNAHPHATDKLSLVHNGIIENYAELKIFLQSKGYLFESETDTEVAAKLIDFYYSEEKDPIAAIYSATKKLTGMYAFGIMFFDRAGEIYGVRHGSPMVIGLADEGIYLSSDVAVFSEYTDRYVRLEEGETVRVCAHGFEVRDFCGNEVQKDILTCDISIGDSLLDGYEHYMQKEINEQPFTLKMTAESTARAIEAGVIPQKLFDGGNIHIVACGSAMHAGLIGAEYIEKWARMPVRVRVASEFKYSAPILKENDVVILISQSGETADTLAALRLAKECGAYTLAVVNVKNSSIATEADKVVFTEAGSEIAVASTKAYSAQLAVMYLLAICLAERVGKMSKSEAERLTDDLTCDVVRSVEKVIENSDKIKETAEKIKDADNVFFIGRGADFFLSQEGSLKLKEISYIHSEAYPAGELKHGTIALISDGTPVIALITQDYLRDKMINNIKEVRARGAEVMAFVRDGIDIPEGLCERVVYLPDTEECFSSFTLVTALQLLAYHTAIFRGCDVDKPRNLAKSVTVE